MEGGRYSIDMGNLECNRTNELARKKSCKGKSHIGSSSQSRDDFHTGYARSDGDAMTDEQLEQELHRHNSRFFQDQLRTIDEEELEDDDVEEVISESHDGDAEEGGGSDDVQDSLKALGASLEVVGGGGGGGIRRCWGNGQLRKKWHDYLIERGEKYVVFHKDLSIRWNSTYKLIAVVLRSKQHFPAFMKQYDNYIINSTEIDTCEKICNALVYFNNAIETFSHVYKPTSNQFIREAINLAGLFQILRMSIL
ncbi:unnamed protein product [Cuscuta europaea]|uniref:Uncharacterized protein n=1 Tax=Cuscuta europaea TaxID=41803 RepID=A0A9P0VQG4_CUSEU|nr:unnamed protein product [Cuscuta europaea]